jgi:hypothetical protein
VTNLSILAVAQLKAKSKCALHIKCNTVTAHSQCAVNHCIPVRGMRIAFAVWQILVNASFTYLCIRVCIFVCVYIRVHTRTHTHIHTLKSGGKKIICLANRELNLICRFLLTVKYSVLDTFFPLSPQIFGRVTCFRTQIISYAFAHV